MQKMNIEKPPIFLSGYLIYYTYFFLNVNTFTSKILSPLPPLPPLTRLFIALSLGFEMARERVDRVLHSLYLAVLCGELFGGVGSYRVNLPL